jgi:hypothetical protein
MSGRVAAGVAAGVAALDAAAQPDLPGESGPSHAARRAACYAALSAVGQMLLADEEWMSTSSGPGAKLAGFADGRQRADWFEKKILGAYVAAHAGELAEALDPVLAALPGPWRFRFAELRQVAKPRAGLDFWLHLTASRDGGAEVPVSEMVNAKFTRGSSPDNTAGKSMLRWAVQGLVGDVTAAGVRPGSPVAEVKELGAVFGQLDEYSVRPSDYYLWVFHYDGPGATVVSSRAEVFSLLELDPEVSLAYNAQQSWPCIQARYGKAVRAPLASVTDERRRLLVWLWGKHDVWLRVQVASHVRSADPMGQVSSVCLSEEPAEAQLSLFAESAAHAEATVDGEPDSL